MGQTIACNCLENIERDPASRGKAAAERLEVLKKGNKFTRNALLGKLSRLYYTYDILATTKDTIFFKESLRKSYFSI